MVEPACYTVHQTPTYLVDHEHLDNLRHQMLPPDRRAIVVGYGEYAKHLVNWFPTRILAIYDPRMQMHGLKFRGVPVIDLPEHVDSANIILAAEYELLYDYLPSILDIYSNLQFHLPSRMNYKPSNELKVFEQEGLYKYLKSAEHDAPAGMMIREKINLLLEFLRFGLTKPGIVVEMGSWQGASAWYMAKTLTYLNESRKLFAMDLFEDHMMDPTATMCSDEIKMRLSSAYDHVEMVQGLVDDSSKLARLQDQAICFAHVDLGWQSGAMDYLWTHLSPGAPMLLDNYGHIASPPWLFDRFAEAHGSRVIRFPWSEQGLLFKSE